MIYKGTDRDAFARASTGLTKKSRSRKYKKYKAQNEKKREQKSVSLFSLKSPYTPKIPKQPMRINSSVVRRAKYVEKKTILDDVRDYRSSKIVSNISNSLATFVVKCGGHQWDNNTKNLVRSSIALAISEVTNKVLEKPFEIINNIKLFIKVGKAIYKIIVWIDKMTNLWVTDDKSVSIVSENNIEYVCYLRKYPRLAESIRKTNVNTIGMKYKVGDIVLLNNGTTVSIVTINFADKTYCALSTEVDKKEYTITDDDICDLVRHLQVN